MADIELVIKIPEEDFEKCKKKLQMRLNVIAIAIAKGTPLPKGHGRLIDADELSKRLVNASMFYRGETADMFDTRFADGLREADIKLSEAPTIIEADKENKE